MKGATMIRARLTGFTMCMFLAAAGFSFAQAWELHPSESLSGVYRLKAIAIAENNLCPNGTILQYLGTSFIASGNTLRQVNAKNEEVKWGAGGNPIVPETGPVDYEFQGNSARSLASSDCRLHVDQSEIRLLIFQNRVSSVTEFTLIYAKGFTGMPVIDSRMPLRPNRATVNISNAAIPVFDRMSEAGRRVGSIPILDKSMISDRIEAAKKPGGSFERVIEDTDTFLILEREPFTWKIDPVKTWLRVKSDGVVGWIHADLESAVADIDRYMGSLALDLFGF
jgi:hypothetical protein